MLLKAVFLSICLKIKILSYKYSTYYEAWELWKLVYGLKKDLGDIVVVLYFTIEQNKFFLDSYVAVNIMIENIHF